MRVTAESRVRRAGPASAWRWVALLPITIAATSAPAVAQARFQWPDTTVDVARYTTVEECLAATQRVRFEASVHEALTVWRDTVRSGPQARLDSEYPAVAAAARRCAARFVEPETDFADHAKLVPLYLMAGRDRDAATLIERWLASLPDTASRATRTAVVDSAVRMYMNAKPARLAAAEALLLHLARNGASRIERLRIYYEMMEKGMHKGDSVLARRYAQMVVAVADSLTREERQSAERRSGFGSMLFDVMQVLIGAQPLLDSLQKSTAAFAALERTVWAQTLGMRPEAFPMPVGEQAPAIEADFWFPGEAAEYRWPRSGRVSLIVFLDCRVPPRAGDADPPGSGPCGKIGSYLRFLDRRFGSKVDILVVSHTHGYLGYAPPPDPATEAQWMNRWVQSWVPTATLAVARSSFWRLPAPDGRVVGRDIANDIAYSFRGRFPLKGGGPEAYYQQRYTTRSILVDQDGVVVWMSGLGVAIEISDMIDALLRREAEGTVGAGVPATGASWR